MSPPAQPGVYLKAINVYEKIKGLFWRGCHIFPYISNSNESPGIAGGLPKGN
jgi:hypothetical protein